MSNTTPVLLIGIVLCCFCISLSNGAFGPALNMYWPTGGAAKCVNITEVPLLYPGVVIPPVCFSYILWDQIYVDNNTLVRNYLGRIGMGGSWDAPNCLQNTYRFFCSLMFRPCVEVPVPTGYGPANSTIAVGQYLRRSYCENTHAACHGAIVSGVEAIQGWTPALVAAALDCDPPWVALYGLQEPGTHIFPNGTYTLSLTADNGTSYFNYTLDAYYANENITITPPATLCPDGLFFQDGLCYFNCPEPLITNSQYDVLTNMCSAMGWLSIVCAAFLAATFLMDPERRKFPANLSVFFILCIFCLSFTFCLGSMVGWRDVWCDSNDHPNLFGAAACTVQGMTFVYFSLASVLWWLVLAFNLLLLVTKVQPNAIKFHWLDYYKNILTPKGLLRWETLWIGYHVFAWIPPFIPLVIALAAQRLGEAGHDIWCTIHSGDPVSFYVDDTGSVQYTGGDPSNIWNLILLTVPILTVVLIGIFILIFVVFWGVWKAGWRFFYQQWRLFLFMLFFIWVYVFSFSFQIDLAVTANQQYQAYDEYINCQLQLQNIVSTADPLASQFECSTSSIDSKVSFPVWFIACFNEASQGVLLFLLYGTSWRFFRTWYLLFRNPKALLSSKYSHTEDTSGKRNFTVEGRKVTETTGQSRHTMVDEIDDSEETTSSDGEGNKTNEGANSSSSDGEGMAMDNMGGSKDDDEA